MEIVDLCKNLDEHMKEESGHSTGFFSFLPLSGKMKKGIKQTKQKIKAR